MKIPFHGNFSRPSRQCPWRPTSGRTDPWEAAAHLFETLISSSKFDKMWTMKDSEDIKPSWNAGCPHTQSSSLLSVLCSSIWWWFWGELVSYISALIESLKERCVRFSRAGFLPVHQLHGSVFSCHFLCFVTLPMECIMSLQPEKQLHCAVCFATLLLCWCRHVGCTFL